MRKTPKNPEAENRIGRRFAGRNAPEWRHVYFIEAEGLGRVKIGCADSARKRLADLQVGSPVKLNLLGVINTDDARQLESHFHRHFAKHRLHGEWFSLTEAMREVVDGLGGDPDDPFKIQICYEPGKHERGPVQFPWLPTDTAQTFAARIFKVCRVLFPDTYGEAA